MSINLEEKRKKKKKRKKKVAGWVEREVSYECYLILSFFYPLTYLTCRHGVRGTVQACLAWLRHHGLLVRGSDAGGPFGLLAEGLATSAARLFTLRLSAALLLVVSQLRCSNSVLFALYPSISQSTSQCIFNATCPVK